MLPVDLNCDMGEGFGAYTFGGDEAMLEYVSSANIACGFHAGDPSTMRIAVRLCIDRGVAIGAHPGLPDLQGFGRRNMAVEPRQAFEMVLYQIGALDAFVRSEGGMLSHVKPHGALYNMAAASRELADAIAEAVYRYNPSLILYGLSGSELTKAGASKGLKVYHEVFADRTYQSDGTLTPRNREGAVIHDVNKAKQQVWQMVKQGKVNAVDGRDVPIKADTICLHGDGAHAVEFAKQIWSLLYEAGGNKGKNN